jgi:hypothetical protein
MPLWTQYQEMMPKKRNNRKTGIESWSVTGLATTAVEAAPTDSGWVPKSYDHPRRRRSPHDSWKFLEDDERTDVSDPGL